MISQAMTAKCAAIRDILDGVVTDIGATDEASFNAKAAAINAKAAAIRTWIPDRDYKRGDMAIDPMDGIPYWALHDHGVTTGHICQPSQSPTMWTHCHGTTPETARPFLAEGHNPYMTGHYCKEGAVVARCKQDNTVHAPSVLPGAWDIII